MPVGSFSFRVMRRVLLVAGGTSAPVIFGNSCGRNSVGTIACTRRAVPIPRRGVPVRPGGRLLIETPHPSEHVKVSLVFRGPRGTRRLLERSPRPDQSRQRWRLTLPGELDGLFGAYIYDSGTSAQYGGRLLPR